MKLRSIMMLVSSLVSVSMTAVVLAGPADLSGRMFYQVTGETVRIDIEQITNTTSNVTTGTLFITMRLTEQSNPFTSGYNVAREALTFGAGSVTNGSLAPGRGFTDLEVTTPFTAPPPGLYYVHFISSQNPDLNTALDVFTFSTPASLGEPPQIRSLGINDSAFGSISVPGEIDVYSIEVTQAGTLTVQSFGNLDTVGLLYDGSGQLVASNDDVGSDLNFGISVDLQPGSYRLDVAGFGSASGDYQVTTLFVPDSGIVPPPPPPPPSADVEIVGTIAFNVDSSGDSVSILVDGFRNDRDTETGPLSLRLLALENPGSSTGLRLTNLSIGALPAGGSLQGFQRSGPFSSPPNGTYTMTLVLVEDTSAGEVVVDSRQFAGTTSFDDGGGGSFGLLSLVGFSVVAYRRCRKENRQLS